MTALIHPASLPTLKGSGFRGGYRMYTVDHIPFDALPAYSDGGPGMATHNGWCVSYEMGGEPGVVLHVYRSYADSEPVPGKHHALYGTRYDDEQSARRAAYEAGAVGFQVFDEHAPLWGLPSMADGQTYDMLLRVSGKPGSNRAKYQQFGITDGAGRVDWHERNPGNTHVAFRPVS